DRLIVLTRDLAKAAYRFGPHARAVASLDEIAGDEPVDAIINLAGAPVVGSPWTEKRRAEIFQSRIGTTDAVLDLVRRLTTPPSVLISASAIGYYGGCGDAVLTEDADPGSGFPAHLAFRWEARAGSASAMRIRTVLLRFGIVLGASGGALSRLAGPVRFGLGAILGSGRQWMSWIHIDDATRLILHALDTPSVAGPVNATSPHPVRAAQMMQTIARTLHRPLLLRVPERLLRTCLGEMASVFLDSARVLPAKLQSTGFQFHFPEIDAAIADLLARPKPPAQHGATRALTAWTSAKG
ncbi:MAG: TIGR01777 family oxidoreductase, partial [Aestuariivirgaceae bacterium]